MSVARRREREREEREERIIDAAEEVFAHKGFGQATMDDIAAAAELAKGTLYNYFPSKEDLYIALTSRMLATLAERFDAVAADDLDAVTAVGQMMREYAALVSANSQKFRTMIGSLASGTPVDASSPAQERHRALIGRITMAFMTVLERGQRAGQIRAALDPVQTSMRIWGGMIGTMLVQLTSAELSARHPHPIDFAAFVPGFIELVCHGLRPGDSDAAS